MRFTCVRVCVRFLDFFLRSFGFQVPLKVNECRRGGRILRNGPEKENRKPTQTTEANEKMIPIKCLIRLELSIHFIPSAGRTDEYFVFATERERQATLCGARSRTN